MALCTRMLWPTNGVPGISPGAQFTVNGHVYVVSGQNPFFDALNGDVGGLQAKGALVVGPSGAVPAGTYPGNPAAGYVPQPMTTLQVFITMPSSQQAVASGAPLIDTQRPLPGASNPNPTPGMWYFDAVLQRPILFDGTLWRDPWSAGMV